MQLLVCHTVFPIESSGASFVQRAAAAGCMEAIDARMRQREAVTIAAGRGRTMGHGETIGCRRDTIDRLRAGVGASSCANHEEEERWTEESGLVCRAWAGNGGESGGRAGCTGRSRSETGQRTQDNETCRQ